VRIVFGSDHGGAELKRELMDRAVAVGASIGIAIETIDVGGDGSDPADDYPDFSLLIGRAILDGRADRGVLLCGSGVGAAIAATKIRGIRASVCHDTYSAGQGVEHDDMNVLCMGARVIGTELAAACMGAFFGATFSTEPRHRRRVAKVNAIEATQGQLDESQLDQSQPDAMGAGMAAPAAPLEGAR
jgi:ribose 5-phosphate isomerase B